MDAFCGFVVVGIFTLTTCATLPCLLHLATARLVTS